jgi:NAD(P)-dependent dehydrogenase (short-subunit alcohol dehydrogenase family)
MSTSLRIALVTGAGSGIGRACALGLLKEGWAVALVGRRVEALQATARLAGDAAARCLPMPATWARKTRWHAAFNAVHQRASAAWTCCSTTPAWACRRPRPTWSAAPTGGASSTPTSTAASTA